MLRLNLIIFLVLQGTAQAQEFTIARIHYSGGGDWYSDPSSLPNLLAFIGDHTSIKVTEKETRIKLTDEELYSNPYLYMTGHGNMRLTDGEIIALREFLLSGAFLHVDDNYGLDDSFRREIKRVFPNRDLVELPLDHTLFNIYYEFPGGLPKVHEHDGKAPQTLAIFDEDRIMVLYTYESDLGDGWEDEEVHHDPWEIRNAALKFGVNIVTLALTQ